jgi:pyrrolidone-carboxylate peptidase
VEIVPGGPAAWFSSLPIKAMEKAVFDHLHHVEPER